MKKVLKAFAQYVLPPLLAAGLIAYLYRDTDLNQIAKQFEIANYFWVLLSAVPLLISHYVRALRWKMLLMPAGYKPSNSALFASTLSAYFVNLLVPRLGEISRCGLLKRIEDVDIDKSVGTVFTERIFDLIALILITALGFIIEYDILAAFLKPLFADKFQDTGMLLVLLLSVGVVFSAAVGLLYKFRKQLQRIPLATRVIKVALGIWEGIASVRYMKNAGLFIAYSVIIWLGYYLMGYFLMLSIPLTAEMGAIVAMTVFILGSYGMVAPVQGGIGPYHFMVSGGLMLYGLNQETANVAAAFLHTIPTLFSLISGGIGFAAGFMMSRSRAEKIDPTSVNA